jgi:hypothetical protein
MVSPRFPLFKCLSPTHRIRFPQLVSIAIMGLYQLASESYLPLTCARPFPHPSQRAGGTWAPILHFVPSPIWEFTLRR